MTQTAATTTEQVSVRPGMVVNLRRRLWRVENVDGGVLTATPIDDFSARPQRFLLALEKPTPGTLPEPVLNNLGDYALQNLFLRAARLDALHGAAPFVCVQRTAIIPVEYQLVPLVMALRQPQVRLLIADTTGLGKTIEAGLIATELLARSRVRSVLIITPASLRDQWRQQMRELFYLDFEIMSGETRKRLERAIPPGADPWRYFDKLIVSIDYAKDIRVRPEIRKRRWDLVIVDESHNVAMPHSHQGRKTDMERWEAVDQISRSCDNLLLLSATPHNGYTDSYCSLLQMLAPDLVQTAANGQPQPDRTRARRHVCQRTRKDIQAWFDEAGLTFPFPAREPAGKTEVAVDLHRDYFRLLEKMDKILDVVDLHAAREGRAQAAEWLRIHFHRRALSSPEALRQSLQNCLDRLKQVDGRQAPEPDADAVLLSSLADTGSSDVQSEDDRDRSADSIILSIEHRLQVEYFAGLLDDLKGIKAAKDRKLIALRDQVLPDLLGRAVTQPDTPARVIVFTRFVDTLTYLQKELARNADFEVISLYGDLSPAERDRRFEQFSASPCAVLLATDVISEGLNLQTAACMVVHYDLPYNPNRLDQRNGRVDRFGQRAPIVYVRTLFCHDTTDEDVMHHLVRKLETMRVDLGFSPPFFATEETVLRVLTRRRKRRAEQPRASLQTTLFDDDEAFFDNDALDRMRTEGFYGQADVRIADVSQRLHEVHRRFGSPDQIRSFIKTGLSHYQCGVEERPDRTLRIDINNPRLRIAGQPARYDRAILDANDRKLHADAVVLDAGHPLIRRLNAVIREDALRQSAEGARTAAHYVSGQRGTLLIAHGLLRATAATRPPTLLEEIVTFGVRAGISGGILTTDEVAEAQARPATARKVDREEAMSRLQTIYLAPSWQEARERAVATALEALRSYRSDIAQDLRTEADAAWLQGFDTVEEVAFDLYCLTLLLPEAL